ncbi:hypothetical protein QJQ45_021455, partial [Haematococcus lacustris]
MEDGVTLVKRPVIRLEGDHLVLTRIDPAERKTSMVMRFRPGWPELLSVVAGPPQPPESQLGPAAAAVARRKFDVYVCTTAERQYALEVWRLVDPGNRIIPKDERRARITNVLQNSQVCRQKALLSTLGLLRSPASEAVAAGLGSSKDDEGTGLLPMAVIVDDRQDVWQPCSQPHILQVMPWLYYRDEAHRQTGYNPSTATQSEGELKRVRDAIVQLRSSVYQSINTQVKPALDLIALHGASEQQQQQNMEGLVEVLRGVPLLL